MAKNQKKTRRLRKKPVVKRYVERRVLSRNFIISLLIIFFLLLFSYLFLEKDRLFSDINRQNNILVTKQDKQKEPLFKTDLNKTLIQTLSKKDDDLKEDIDLSKELLDKVKQIKDDKKTQLQEEEITVDEIEDEIIEKIEIKKTDDKQIITSKDKYKFDQEKKAKLVIIIDDVVSKSQKQKILNIGYPITMAFLPPTKEQKESSKIAQDLAFYMVHFPLEASKNFKNFEDNTLNISDSYEKIESRVKQLRTWYPKAIYTNNHTGSIFTENYEAMDKLFRALIKYNFIFVDSKTTPNSVAKELSLKYKVPYIVRDVFLDNERNYTAIQNQLKEAIRVAKKQGFAIAIGHPYDVTFKVLKESKHLLNDVEPIFLNKLPYL